MRIVCFSCLVGILSGSVFAEEPTQAPSGVFASPAKYLDPAQYYPKELLQVVGDGQTELTLSQLADLLSEHGIKVKVDTIALMAEGFKVQEVTAVLPTVPLYLAINRFFVDFAGDIDSDIAWYIEDRLLRITTEAVTEELLRTRVFNISDLKAAGFDEGLLSSLIPNQTIIRHPGLEGIGITGEFGYFKNALVVRQKYAKGVEAARLLDALRANEPIVYVTDSPENGAVRAALQKTVSVDFQGDTLSEVAAVFEDLAGIPVVVDRRLEEHVLDDSFKLSGHFQKTSLLSVCDILLNEVGLGVFIDAIPFQGTLLLTTREQAEELLHTVVVDVRHLVNVDDIDSLIDLIETQTYGPWFEFDGTGSMIDQTPHGRIVFRQNERLINEVLQLLSDLEPVIKLRESAPPKDPQSIERNYYRMDSIMADDLMKVLPETVAPQTWKSLTNPDAIGTIHQVHLKGRLSTLSSNGANSGFFQFSDVENPNESSVIIQNEHSALVIQQTVEVHEDIRRFLNELRYGDPEEQQ